MRNTYVILAGYLTIQKWEKLTNLKSLSSTGVKQLRRRSGGLSLGGCLSCLITIHHLDLVRSLMLISTAPSFGEDVFSNTLDLHDELKAHRDILESCLTARKTLSPVCTPARR